MLDDLAEAVYHAIVCLVSGGFAGLELSRDDQMEAEVGRAHGLHSSLDDI